MTAPEKTPPAEIWIASQDDDGWPYYWSGPGDPKELCYVPRETYATLAAEKERLESERDEYSKALVAAVGQLSAMGDNAEALAARVRSLEEALQLLMDVQNGPPLVTYEAQWNEAMARARAALSTPREETTP